MWTDRSSIKMHDLNYFNICKGPVEVPFQVVPLYSMQVISWSILETAQIKSFSLPNAAWQTLLTFEHCLVISQPFIRSGMKWFKEPPGVCFLSIGSLDETADGMGSSIYRQFYESKTRLTS